MKKFLPIIFSALLLSGCRFTSVEWPDDVQLVSVIKEDAPIYVPDYDIEVIAEEFVDNETGQITPASEEDVKAYMAYGDQQLNWTADEQSRMEKSLKDDHSKTLKVTFSTKNNLANFFENESLGDYYSQFFACANPSIYFTGIDGGRIFWNNVEIEYLTDVSSDELDQPKILTDGVGFGGQTKMYQRHYIRKDRSRYAELVKNHQPDKPILYTTYFHYNSNEDNLLDNPQDVCFTIEASSNMVYSGAKSPMLFRIPKATITTSLKHE